MAIFTAKNSHNQTGFTLYTGEGWSSKSLGDLKVRNRKAGRYPKKRR